MVMMHTSTEAYEVTAARAAAGARAKLNAIIERGTSEAQRAFEGIFSRSIEDALVKPTALKYSLQGSKLMLAQGSGAPCPLTEHAMSQSLTRAGIHVPGIFARKLLSSAHEGTREILPTILRELNAHEREEDDRTLVRVVDGSVRAVLSDRFKRVDSRPTLYAFAECAAQRGMVPMFGCSTDIKDHFRVILPEIFEPVPHEVMVFGLEWSNSDWGAGPNTVKVFCLRLMCTNTMMADSLLRQVHLGKQLDAMDFEEASVKTRELAAQTSASAMQDIVGAWLDDGRIEQYCEVVRNAAETNVDTGRALSALYSQKKVSKGERDALEKLADVQDVEVLPATPGTAWRLSNMVSFFAQQTANPIRARELESLAGHIVTPEGLRSLPTVGGRAPLALPASLAAAE